MTFLASLFCLLGVIVLSLSKKRLRKDGLPRYKALTLAEVRSLIVIGLSLLLTSLVIFIRTKGLGLGLTYAFGWFAMSGLSLTVLLSYVPRVCLWLLSGTLLLLPVSIVFVI
ncbi:DUF3325 family protein [Spongiibacter sp. UBA1325]|uniref:DUF3325 family protein n=1 Tax=Spongiibacter sp. UBA1325 TaxID=1947543 RepID=UPI00257CA74E|nr:DUF3325 family protein [Spongiibacter sp. UBA1325]|tara:strand:+ start:4370 stop:4705 length:336 start_codon:yes stop_codon:yes gene_type:complete